MGYKEKLDEPAQKASKSAKTDPHTSFIRGLQRLQEALLNKTSAHRAMWSESLGGWVDCDYGRIGQVVDEYFKTIKAMGITHVIDKRSVADTLSPEEVALVLRSMVRTIAYGKAAGRDAMIQMSYKGFNVVLTKRGGNNFVITAVGSISSERTSSARLGMPSPLPVTLDARYNKYYAGGRDRNVSELVEIIAKNKLLFKDGEENLRKASKGTANRNNSEQNVRNVVNGLNKTWTVSTTKQLIDSGKVVICGSNEEFIEQVARDEAATGEVTYEEAKEGILKNGFALGTNGLYSSRTGKIYLNGENIDENEAGATLAHELAVHALKDSQFRDLVKEMEKRIRELAVEGLNSKNLNEKKFWRGVISHLYQTGFISREDNILFNGRGISAEELLNSLDKLGQEELLAYFMTEHTKLHGVSKSSAFSRLLKIFEQVKETFMRLLGVSRLNSRQVADVLTEASRVLAEEGSKVSHKRDASEPVRKASFAGPKGMANNPVVMANKKVAEQMSGQGLSEREIKAATGWEKGVDGKWRYERPDLKVKKNLNPDVVKRLFSGDSSLTLKDIFDAPEIFKEYPELANYSIRLGVDPHTIASLGSADVNGVHNAIAESVTLNPALMLGAYPKAKAAVEKLFDLHQYTT